MSVIGIILIGKPSQDKEDLQTLTFSDDSDTFSQTDIADKISLIETNKETKEVKQFIPFNVAIKEFATWHL